jgi:hypothetical protein
LFFEASLSMSDQSTYDVFLSYNSADHRAVEKVARALTEQGLTVFLDRWYLVPGRPWPQALEGILEACGAVAVFLGPQGLGNWQQREKELALDRQAPDSTFPVIPVLLPGAADPSPGFLCLNTWVDFREGITNPVGLEILAKAIRGQPPGHDLQERVADVRADVCPYRGMRPFREEDAPFFCGRGDDIERLMRAVEQHSLVALVGASGSGKSSVVFAGLVPKLRQARLPEAVWDVASFTPGDRPYHRLAAALVTRLDPEGDEYDRRAKANRWATGIAKGEVSLRDLVEEVLEKQAGTDRLLLVADQFEELYTPLTQDEAVQRAFLDHLLETTADPLVQLVLTLRGDFYGRALSHTDFARALEKSVVNLGPMEREDLEEVIVGPAQQVGLTFEEWLVKRILDDVGKEPGNLPLLEFALTQMWEQRHGAELTSAAYDAMGGVQGAIAQRAEQEFNKLSETERDVTRRVMLRLTQPGEGTEDTRRRAPLAELLPAEGDVADVETVVQKLADARLLTTGQDERGGEIVDVAHEALIRNWPRLQEWINENRESLLRQRRLREAAREWSQKGRDEGYLYRGARLASAEEWAAESASELTDLDRAFLGASRAAGVELAARAGWGRGGGHTAGYRGRPVWGASESKRADCTNGPGRRRTASQSRFLTSVSGPVWQ